MAVQVAQSKTGKVRAKLGLRVRLRDGRTVDLGEVSSRPFLRHLEQYRQDYRINHFRVERGAMPLKFRQLPVNLEEVTLTVLYVGTALLLAWIFTNGVPT